MVYNNIYSAKNKYKTVVKKGIILWKFMKYI